MDKISDVEAVVNAAKAALSKRIANYLAPLDASLRSETDRRIRISTRAFDIVLSDTNEIIIGTITSDIDTIRESLEQLREKAAIELEKSKARRFERLAFARQIDALFVEPGVCGSSAS